MKKFKFKKINYMHYIAITITISFLLLSVFYYQNSFIRIKETWNDLYTSFIYNFQTLSNSFITVRPTINKLSSVDILFVFPMSWPEFVKTLELFWKALFTEENFLGYLETFSNLYLIVITLAELVFIIILLLKNAIDKNIETQNNTFTETKPLKVFKWLELRFKPIKKWLKDFWTFCFSGHYKTIWLFIWLYNLNVFTIIGEFLAYYLYFIASFDLANLYVQVYKLLFDVLIALKGLPTVIWLILAVIVLNKWRKNKGYENLEHFESMNTGFVKNLPTVNVFYGLMGGGKGQIMTDITLTTNKIFRSNAKETLQKLDRMFIYFPFAVLEQEYKRLVRTRVIYSLATIESYVRKRKTWFEHAIRMNLKKSARVILYGYDYEKYGLTYDNNLYLQDIFEVIEEYLKAYRIYTTVEMNITNYAIRSDGILQDLGNFPLWDFDFFHRKSHDIPYISRYGKILDQDILRMGKTVVPDNPLANTLEYGIVVMTELDKERGNQYVLQELKSNDDKTNQKNDLFNFGLKLDRHPSTVDYKPYMRIYFDLQRIGSTNSDLHECGNHLGVGKKNKKEFAMPLFFIEEFIAGVFDSFYNSFFDRSKYYHSNNTLLLHLIKKFLGGFYNYYEKMYNLFGYDLHFLQMEDMLSGQVSEHPYYLCYKKNHARRYYTDSLVDYFRQNALKKKVGLDDYPEYAGVKATKEEFAMQNSYFQHNLNNVFDSEKDDAEQPTTKKQKLQLKKPR